LDSHIQGRQLALDSFPDKIKIALLGVQTMKNGAKHPRIAGAMGSNHATNGSAV
jgi:hypothetical protein